jgi:serine/threonine protein phosphatase PrpC
MGHTAIQLARCGALILMALALIVGCASPNQARSSRQSSAPTPTPPPAQSPASTGNSPCTSTAQNGNVPPLVTLDQYSIHPGADFGFSGYGFQPGEGVDVRLGTLKSDPQSKDNLELTTAHANNEGNLTGTAHVPMMSPGTFHVYFIGQQCTGPLTVNLILLAFTPWVTLDNYAPYPHYRMGFQGHAFAPNEPVNVYLNQQSGDPVAQVQADNSGQFAVNQAWDVGDLSGENTLLFVGTYTKLVVSVQFIVLTPQTPGPLVALLQSPPGMAAVHAGVLLVPPASVLARAGGVAAAQDDPSGPIPFLLNLDPMLFVLGFLVIWFILCIVLAAILSLERLPSLWRSSRLWRFKWPAKQSVAFSQPKPASELTAEPVRWAKTLSRGLPTPGIQISSRTERGQMSGNLEKEDHFLAITGIRQDKGQLHPFALLVVADGVGHYADGQSAGHKALHSIFQDLAPGLIREDLPTDDLSAQLASALQRANRLLYWHNQRESVNTSCSVTAALVSCQQATICNVGNSRAYLLPSHAPLRRVTTDHSIVERCVSAGIMQRGDLYTCLRRSRLYRSLGQHPDVRVDAFRLPVGTDDQLLLCSNGLWEILADADLETLLRASADVTSASNRLIERAKEHSLDNITAMMLRFEVAPPAQQQPGIDIITSGSSHPSRQPIF